MCPVYVSRVTCVCVCLVCLLCLCVSVCVCPVCAHPVLSRLHEGQRGQDLRQHTLFADTQIGSMEALWLHGVQVVQQAHSTLDRQTDTEIERQNTKQT